MTHEFYQLKSWSEEYGHSSGLTLGQTAALVGLTASLLTMGAGSTLVGSQAWLAGYMEALVVAGAGQVASTFVASHGDPIAAFRSLGSEAFLKSMAISLATMGVVGSAGAGATLGDKVLMSIKRAAFSSVLKIGLTQENPRDILRGAFAQVAGEIDASAIGEFRADLDYVPHKLLHGFVGAAQAAIAGKDVVTGIVGAVASEVIAEGLLTLGGDPVEKVLREATDKGEVLSSEELHRRVQHHADIVVRQSRFLTATMGAFMGMDVNDVDGAASNALNNNFLHAALLIAGGAAIAWEAWEAYQKGGEEAAIKCLAKEIGITIAMGVGGRVIYKIGGLTFTNAGKLWTYLCTKVPYLDKIGTYFQKPSTQLFQKLEKSYHKLDGAIDEKLAKFVGSVFSKKGMSVSAKEAWILKAMEKAEGKATSENARQFWKKDVQFKGNKVYQRDDLIDPMKVVCKGKTNLQLMKEGGALYGPDGKPIKFLYLTMI